MRAWRRRELRFLRSHSQANPIGAAEYAEESRSTLGNDLRNIVFLPSRCWFQGTGRSGIHHEKNSFGRGIFSNDFDDGGVGGSHLELSGRSNGISRERQLRGGAGGVQRFRILGFGAYQRAEQRGNGD